MALSPPSGFSSSTKTPTIALAVQLGVSSHSSGSAPMKLLLLGNKTSAGTAVVETPVFVPSVDDARNLFGAKSELLAMAKAVFAQKRNPNLWACPVAENGSGTAATGTVVFAVSTPAAGTATVWVAGKRFDVPVATTSTATTLGDAFAALVNAVTDFPVTAVNASGTVTLTAAQKGPRGKNITLRGLVATTGVTIALAGGSASLTPAAIKLGTAGAGADDVTNALLAIGALKFDLIAMAQDDDANVTLVKTHCNTYAGVADRRRQRLVAANVQDLGTVSSAGTGAYVADHENAPRAQVIWHYLADKSTGEIAAQAAAFRLWGDGLVGGGVGRVKGIEAYRACNLDAGLLASITSQDAPADQPTGSEIESALNAGLTPLARSEANPGFCKVVKSITTRWKDSAGNASYTVHDTSKVDVADYVADTIEADIGTEFANKNLAPESTDGSPPPTPDVIFPSMVRAFIAKRLYEFEKLGLCVNVEANLALLQVEPDPNNDTTLLAEIPLSVIPHFHSFAGTLSQIA